MQEKKDIALELFDTIFEIRRYDDVEYDYDGEIKYINNIMDIGNEFFDIKNLIKPISELLKTTVDKIYRVAIDSYIIKPEFQYDLRISYILGIGYARFLQDDDLSNASEKELIKIIQKRWYNYQKFIMDYPSLVNSLNSATLLGIYDQSNIEYENKKNRK